MLSEAADPSPAAPVAPRPMRLWDDAGLQQIGWLAVLLVLIVGEFPLARALRGAVAGVWISLVLVNWPGLSPSDRRRGWSLLCVSSVVVLVALSILDLNWLGLALPLQAVILLAGLLPFQETKPAAADWGMGVAVVLWTAIGILGIQGLLTIATPLGSAAIPVLGALIAYNAGLRAGQRQGLSERVATGIGMTLAVAGAIALGPTGVANLALVGGLALGLLAVQVAPAPPALAAPVVRQTTVTALLAAHGQIVFVAPLTFALLWLVRTVAP